MTADEVNSEPESLVVTTDTGDRIHYLDWGRPSASFRPATERLPPLLLIHGLLATAWSWTPVARRLRHSTHVLALDLRGHGLSDSPRSGYDLESLAFDALTVLVANGYGKDADGPPAVVAGHGLGAMVAASMAAIQPESICGLALVEGGWEDLAEATGLTAADYQRSIGDPPEVMASMDAYLADRREYDPDSWDTDQERAARAAVDEKYAGHVTSVVRAHALRGGVEAMFEFRPREALGSLEVPLLLAVAETGAADDETARERRIAIDDVIRQRTAAGLAAPDVRIFAGAGHNLMRYRPAELSADLLELIERAAHQRP
ncbi:MAG TPA: alpha/beta hydrolase [Candidatus Limnocylindrales bacterium]|nr:alpha/beta hydrolase [Candidatus Limnocylindrales bacterium]